jgi:AbrB family looped-hinge helix DNA binding protein
LRAGTKLTTKGQVVIPKALRQRLRWRPGTRLEAESLDAESIRLRRAREDLVDELYGSLAGLPGDPIADLEAEHRAEVAADERWIRTRR